MSLPPTPCLPPSAHGGPQVHLCPKPWKSCPTWPGWSLQAGGGDPSGGRSPGTLRPGSLHGWAGPAPPQGSQTALCPLSPEDVCVGPSVLAWASCPTLSLLECCLVLILPLALWGLQGTSLLHQGQACCTQESLAKGSLPFPPVSPRTEGIGFLRPHAVSWSPGVCRDGVTEGSVLTSPHPQPLLCLNPSPGPVLS